jgi:hypothetical protein
VVPGLGSVYWCVYAPATEGKQCGRYAPNTRPTGCGTVTHFFIHLGEKRLRQQGDILTGDKGPGGRLDRLELAPQSAVSAGSKPEERLLMVPLARHSGHAS